MNPRDWLGKHVHVFAGYDWRKEHGPIHEGEVIGVIDCPSLVVRGEDGTVQTWPISLPMTAGTTVGFERVSALSWRPFPPITEVVPTEAEKAAMEDAQGVWVAFNYDGSAFVPFGSEIEAYRYAADFHMNVKFAEFGNPDWISHGPR